MVWTIFTLGLISCQVAKWLFGIFLFNHWWTSWKLISESLLNSALPSSKSNVESTCRNWELCQSVVFVSVINPLNHRPYQHHVIQVYIYISNIVHKNVYMFVQNNRTYRYTLYTYALAKKTTSPPFASPKKPWARPLSHLVLQVLESPS